MPQPMSRAQRANRDYLMDVGLDPDNPTQMLKGGAGLSLAWGRADNRRMEGLNPNHGAGARTINDQDLNRYTSTRSGSGSMYDDLDTGGTRTVTRKYWADEVLPTRSRRDGPGQEFVDPYDIYQQRGRAMRDQMRPEMAQAEAQQRQQLLRAETMRKRLEPDLVAVFDRLPDHQKAYVLEMAPERQYATLASHPLRPVKPRLNRGGAVTNGGFRATDYGDMTPVNIPGIGSFRVPGNTPSITPRGAGGVRPAAMVRSVVEDDPFDQMDESDDDSMWGNGPMWGNARGSY